MRFYILSFWYKTAGLWIERAMVTIGTNNRWILIFFCSFIDYSSISYIHWLGRRTPYELSDLKVKMLPQASGNIFIFSSNNCYVMLPKSQSITLLLYSPHNICAKMPLTPFFVLLSLHKTLLFPFYRVQTKINKQWRSGQT